MPDAFSKSTQIYPVSVVIPTLGGESLRSTIEQLNRGTIVPAEILICIPHEDTFRVKDMPFANIRVVKTHIRGQVAQRALGFQEAKEELVLQLDDDIYLSEQCLQNLINCSLAFSDVAVGPKMYDMRTKKYHSFLAPFAASQRWYERFLFWVINGAEGYKPGQISSAGINMGIPEFPDDWNDLGWLPGGCLLHQRKNLILYNYYPFMGKAYAEDLFHSELLRKNGVKLMRCGSAACDVNFTSSGAMAPVKFIKIYFAYTRTMARFIKQIDGSYMRLYLFLVLNLVRLVGRKFIR